MISSLFNSSSLDHSKSSYPLAVRVNILNSLELLTQSGLDSIKVNHDLLLSRAEVIVVSGTVNLKLKKIFLLNFEKWNKNAKLIYLKPLPIRGEEETNNLDLSQFIDFNLILSEQIMQDELISMVQLVHRSE